MKYLLALCLFLSFSANAAFVNGTDVPLMDGFVVNENDSFSFDTPEGQIITVIAQTTASKKEVLRFYQESLNALGWQQKTGTKYYRDQDELSLDVTPQKEKTKVKLQLTFANK